MREGYVFDNQILKFELYKLLCFIKADEFIENEASRFYDLIAEFSDDQIILLLISIAINVRIIDDRDKNYLTKYDTGCGKLYINVNKTKKPLDLRNACNKIIHAKKIRYEVNKDNKRLPFIHLYGNEKNYKTRIDEKWKATIDLYKFIEVINNYVFY
jgi:hypothetical protein